jgi:DNA-3-methyladenine glycosylase
VGGNGLTSGDGLEGGGGLASAELVPRSFFGRPSTVVAPELLGLVLVHDDAQGRVAARIVEVEAYMGSEDPASHAFRGRTARNGVMFGEPGHVYVYFTYGMHFCANLVCELPGDASAVLLRAGWIVEGTDLAVARRSVSVGPPRPDGRALARLASGPARLCQALGVARAQNGADACSPESALRVYAPAGFAGVPADQIAAGPRVGVSSAAEVQWRFWVAGDKAVSAYRPHVPRHQRRRSEAERLLPGS